MAKHAVVALALFSVAATSAAAQDFGTDWIDRVSQQLTQERGPLKATPWELHVSGGAAYYFDDNIYLTEDDEVDSSVVIPFVRATATYTEPRFEFQGDLLANYKWYSDPDDDNTPGEEDPDGDEERLYLRVRQAGTRYSLELAQIIQHVTDPINVVFEDRAERLVSNTIPRLEFDLSRQWGIEASANYQVVRYEDSVFQPLESNSGRVEGALVYRTARGYDLLAQIGYQDIGYRNDITPDAWGWYGRIGWRGNLVERLYAEVLVGFDHIESDYFPGTTDDQTDNTFGAFAALRYELSQTATLSAEYARQFVFAGAGDPYQRIDRVLGILDWELAPEFGVKLRGQYDHASTALSVERSYASAGGALWWKPIEWLILDGGATFRTGDAEDQTGAFDTEYDNLIFHVGAAATF